LTTLYGCLAIENLGRIADVARIALRVNASALDEEMIVINERVVIDSEATGVSRSRCSYRYASFPLSNEYHIFENFFFSAL